MAVNYTPSLSSGLGPSPVKKSDMQAWLNEISSGIASLDPRATPIYASRASAVSAAPGLPASLTHMMVREGTALVIRSRTASADDPLFPSGAQWGVVMRQDVEAEAAARAQALQDAKGRENHTGTQPIETVAGLAEALSKKADKISNPKPIPVHTGTITFDLRGTPLIFADVEGEKPIAPTEEGRAVARWDVPYNGALLSFVQPFLGNRPVLFRDSGRPYLDFGGSAYLEYKGPATAMFSNATGFTISAGIRRRKEATLENQIGPVIGASSALAAQWKPRVALVANRETYGASILRVDSTNGKVYDYHIPNPSLSDQVLTATHDYTEQAGFFMRDGAIEAVTPISAPGTSFGPDAPKTLYIGRAGTYVDGRDMWAGRFYNGIMAARKLTTAEIEAVVEAQRSQLPNTELTRPPVFEDFDLGFGGRGWSNGGGEMVGVRTQSWTGSGNGYHYLVGVSGCEGHHFKAAVLKEGQISDVQRPNTWRAAWTYDLAHGEWSEFDFETETEREYLHENITPCTEDTIFVALRPAFNNDRWMAAISRWVRSPLTSPTPNGDYRYRVGHIPAAAGVDGRTAPGFDVHALKIGTGPIFGVMTGNTHIAEHAGAFMMEAAVDWLLSDDPKAVALRQAMTIYVYPGINAQARHLAIDRMEITNYSDANRMWSSDYDHVPYSKIMRDAWVADLSGKNLKWALDFHDSPGTVSHAQLWNAGQAPTVYKNKANQLYNARTGKNVVFNNNPGDTAATISNFFRTTFPTVALASLIEYGFDRSSVEDWKNWSLDAMEAMHDTYQDWT